MEEKNHTDAIPENHSGDSLDAETVINCTDIAEANALYTVARERLLNVSQWQQVAGEALAHFTLTDVSGNPLSGHAQKGNLIKINIPGPGTTVADGFDWVLIEEVIEDTSADAESVAVRVRPAADPSAESEETAHFYDKQSTSTFTVSKVHLTVTAGVYDRNLEANQDSTGIFDKIRNAIIGFAGKKGVSTIQWKAFTDGLLAK